MYIAIYFVHYHAVLTPDKSCLYNGIQINDGDVFRPTSIVEDYQSQQPDVRNECVECVCAVSHNITLGDSL